jgi:hypothetical protein
MGQHHTRLGTRLCQSWLGPMFTKRSPFDTLRCDEVRRALRALEVGRRWGLSGTPESFLDSPSSIAKAGNCFGCDVNIRSASIFVELFVEHFCRQARVSFPVQVNQHVNVVTQTANERAVYLEEVSGKWCEGDVDLSQRRQLLMLCSHFTTNVALDH